MNKRSYLDRIEDEVFTSDNLVFKGKSVDEVRRLLQKRGATDTEIDLLIKNVEDEYQGVTRILCSKSKRVINFLVDFFLLTLILIFSIIQLDKNEYFTSVILCIAGFSIFFIYIIPEAIWGMTAGKLVTNTIVVDKNGKIPSLFWVLIRTILRVFSLKNIISFNVKGRPKHDIYSKTYVVSKDRWLKKYKTSQTDSSSNLVVYKT